MTIRDWEQKATAMTDVQLRERIAALKVLKDWDTFRDEFAEFGTFTLIAILEREVERRKM